MKAKTLLRRLSCRHMPRVVLTAVYSWHYQWACNLHSGLSFRELIVPLASVLLRFARARLRQPAMLQACVTFSPLGCDSHRIVVLAGMPVVAYQLGAPASAGWIVFIAIWSAGLSLQPPPFGTASPRLLPAQARQGAPWQSCGKHWQALNAARFSPQ